MAVQAGLIYVSDAEPGIRRLRAGKGFRYLTPENRRLAAAKELKRIAGLAIPPAYRDVWISVKPRGHLQATGRDARGRKQYRYHPEWRQVRDSAKFDRMVAFGEALPKLRRKLRRDMALPGCRARKCSRWWSAFSTPPACASATANTRATTRVSASPRCATAT
jgi:DNA topoisomerase-1